MNNNATRHSTPTRPHPPMTVKTGLTPKRRTRPVVENDDYAAFTGRVLRAHARRIASGDIEGLTDLGALDDGIQNAIHTAVSGLRATGYSWAEIGQRLGITRQAAQQRFGAPDRVTATTEEGTEP